MGLGDWLRQRLRRKASTPTNQLGDERQIDQPDGFAVIDVETTGLTPDSDRVIEIAVVRTDTSGRVVDEWTTLLNPGGPVGPTFVHGISVADVRDAPTFAQVVGELNARLTGRTVVAHNAAFDLAFVRAEYVRAGWTLPAAPFLCTLEASLTYLPELDRRRLVDCCWALEIPLTDAHSALGDARATAALLAHYLDVASRLRPAPHHLTLPALASQAVWPPIPLTPATVAVRRVAGRPVPAAPGTLWALLDALPLSAVVEQGAPAQATDYLELLFEVFEDGVLTDEEARSLADIAGTYSLTREQVHATHQGFLRALAHRIVEDGKVTRAEKEFLAYAATALGVEDDLPRRVLDEAMSALATQPPTAPAPLPPEWSRQPLRVGQSVAFTGCDPLERARLEARAYRAGLRVTGSVSRRTTVLVTDGASPHTAKAQFARALETPIVSPAVFAALIDSVEPTRSSGADVEVDSPAETGDGLAAVRSWAREHGMPVGVRGRVSQDVLNAYHRTHDNTGAPHDGRHHTPAQLPPALDPVRIPGTIEVQVSGESFHMPAIRTIQAQADGPVVAQAVLVPEPEGDHDCQAVAVYLDTLHVGYIPGEISRNVKSAIRTFSAQHDGRPIGCDAQILDWGEHAQVVLLVDIDALGLSPIAVATTPSLAAKLQRALARLDQQQPDMQGMDADARVELEVAERAIADVDGDYERSRGSWSTLEARLRGIADRLAAADDSSAARAWLGIGRTTRYQRSRSEDTTLAFVEALYFDRANTTAWCDLITYHGIAPHAPTLVDLFVRVPQSSRPDVLKLLVSMSYGHDRFGRLDGEIGTYLREQLLAEAERASDHLTSATLLAINAIRAEGDGDQPTASAHWVRAQAAGASSGHVAESYTKWLLDRKRYMEAQATLTQVLENGAVDDDTRRRLERRLRHCHKMTSSTAP